MSDKSAFLTRAASAYAKFILRHPGKVLLFLLTLGVAATWATTRLTIEPNQLDLISQELPEVKEVKRVIDMVGGAGYLMLALRADDEKALKRTADDIAEVLRADKENVRFVTYKVPVEFIQDNMTLFIKTADLKEGKQRINAYLKDQLRRNNPFFIEIKKTEPVKLDLKDLVDKYSSVGKKSIIDDYYISNDRKMMMILIKPMWNSTELERTQVFVKKLDGYLQDIAKKNGIALVEDYDKMGDAKTLYYGYTGSYKTSLDDSYAITESLEPVIFFAFAGIVLIALIFFRKVAPSVIVISGMALGTVLTMGFTYVTIGELNMVTSILGGILMGFGVDYGIHFTYRTRIELGLGKPYDVAIHDAIVNAGRPALIAAIVTGGSFFVLMVSEFRGFSQFGFLAGFGTLIIGFTLFSWSPAILALLGRRWPELPKRLIGTMTPLGQTKAGGDFRVPRPKLVLGLCVLVVGGMCAFAIPWSSELPAKNPTLLQRLKSGTRFDYNTRALMPTDQPSVKLQDEVALRFNISADPTAVYTKTLEEAREVFDELTLHPEKYSSIDQVVS
ncbi:MAG: MMPL family transporter, partial [Myxococcaceae bacterium]